MTRTYSAVIRGTPDSAPDLKEAGLGDWTAEWETKDESDEKLGFGFNDQGNVVIDTAGSGICGKAVMKKEVSIPSGESKRISFDYKASGEDLAGEIGIWGPVNKDTTDPENLNVAPNNEFNLMDEWHTWSITLENKYSPSEVSKTVEVGLKDGDDHCGIMSSRKGMHLVIKGKKDISYSDQLIVE
jgi:hypothetical protein